MFKPAAQIKVLFVGHEQRSRDTYSEVFHTAGYGVHAVPVEALAITLKATNFDVLVMDHTLSEQERKAGIYIAHQLVPKMHTLVLHSSGTGCGADMVVDSREEASVILEALAKLLDHAP